MATSQFLGGGGRGGGGYRLIPAEVVADMKKEFYYKTNFVAEKINRAQHVIVVKRYTSSVLPMIPYGKYSGQIFGHRTQRWGHRPLGSKDGVKVVAMVFAGWVGGWVGGWIAVAVMGIGGGGTTFFAEQPSGFSQDNGDEPVAACTLTRMRQAGAG